MSRTRVAFNSGEIDEEVSLRVDVDAVSRACLRLENWEVSDMGGIRRRRGLKHFAPSSEESALFPFVYTYANAANMRFIVEVRQFEVNVYSIDGKRVAHFESQLDKPSMRFEFTPRGVRYKQINKLLILTSLEQKPWVIKYNDGEEWVMEPYIFKNVPWRFSGSRQETVTLRYENEKYYVDFDETLSEDERQPQSFDLLRLSYWTEQQETRASSAELCSGVKVMNSPPASARAGDKFALRTEEVITYWVCKKEFDASVVYCPGLDDPSSYPDNFIRVDNAAGFEGATPVTSVKDLSSPVQKNTKIAMKSGYWEYYTCIKDFARGNSSSTSLLDFPSNFIRGIEVGAALPCKGAWSFYCSGLWYGAYEVRRNYETKDLSPSWETRGVSFSQVGGASNVQIAGTEETEECYLRLFLTKSRYMGTDIKSGFPPDGCDNKLIVESYKHNELLEYHTIGDVWLWENVTPIPGAAVPSREIKDWSWSAFSARYGYPLLCEVFNQRLVLASTPAQPQTLWFSAVDDLNNFELGSSNNSGMELTINDTSLNPMCWLQSQNNRLLVGTSEAEWVIAAGQGGFYAGNATISDHGHYGSDGVSSLATSDKVLYVERGGGRVYEYGYSYESDGYLSKDLTQLAPHIAREHGGIVGCTFIKKPNSVAVFVLGDGQLALCTYNRTQQVNAWGRWVTAGQFLAAAALPNGNKNDLLFLLVRRESGVNIEVYSTENEYEDDGNDYESVVLTNALFNVFETRVGKQTKTEFALKLGEEVSLLGDDGEHESGAVQISGDGDFWLDVDRGGAKLKKGWDKWVPPAGIEWEPRLGVKVRGKRGFALFCIQV